MTGRLLKGHGDNDALISRHGSVVREFATFAEASKGRRFTRNWIRELEANPEDRVAEALVWRMLSDGGCRPRIEVGIPGTEREPDFKCTSEIGGSFYAEVAALRAEDMEKRTGFDPLEFCAFSFDGPKVSAILDRKNAQCRESDLPVIVVVVTFFLGSSVLFGPLAAEELMWGGTGIIVPLSVGSDGDLIAGEDRIEAMLQHSPFLGRDGLGRVLPKNRNISALLLMAIDDQTAKMLALESVDPHLPLDSRLLDGVPVLRVEPTAEGEALGLKWNCANPKPVGWRLP